MEQQLWHEIETIEESKKMRYVTSVEKIGIAKGWQEGRQEGLLEGEAKILSVMHKHRFGDLPEATLNKLMGSNETPLKKWLISAITATTLDAVFSDDLTH